VMSATWLKRHGGWPNKRLLLQQVKQQPFVRLPKSRHWRAIS